MSITKSEANVPNKSWLFALGALAVFTLMSHEQAPTGFNQRSRGRELFDHTYYKPALQCSVSSANPALPMEQHYLVDLYNVANESLLLLEPGVVSQMTDDVASHISFHAWPDRNFIAFDVYTCGDGRPDVLVDRLVALLKPGSVKKMLVQRGDPHLPDDNLAHVAPERLNNNINHAAKLMPAGLNTFGVANTLTVATNQTGSDSQILRTEDVCVNADSPDDDCMMLKSTHILADLQSEFQHVEVADTQSFGRCMFLDRIVQFCLADNHVYTSNIVDRVLDPFVLSPETADFSDPTAQPISIQIVGGGDGWVASYIFDKYANSVRSVSLVDIDPAVSEMTQKYFAPVGKVNSFIDPRVEWVYADAGKWLSEKSRAQSVEVVVIDCTDHNVGSSGVLYTREFYQAVHNMLKPGGRVVQQMNIEDAEYLAFLQETDSFWKDAGFKNIVKWTTHIASFGGNASFWMAEA